MLDKKLYQLRISFFNKANLILLEVFIICSRESIPPFYVRNSAPYDMFLTVEAG